jgi:hypothetical protein
MNVNDYCFVLESFQEAGMGKMIEVVIDSLRVSLTNQQRVVVLHEKDSENYLPIWIGPYEAEAITIALQDVEVSRPLTHDLLKNVFGKLNARIVRVEVSSIRDDVFFGTIIAEMDGETVEIDSRPSDAIALAVRAHVGIFVDADVMAKAGIHPEEEVTAPESSVEPPQEQEEENPSDKPIGNLSVFEDFLNNLDMGDLKPDDDEPDDKPV